MKKPRSVLTHCRLPSTRPDDQQRHKDDAHSAHDDVGDISYRFIEAGAQDAAFGVDAHRGRRGVCGQVNEDGWTMIFQLASSLDLF